jgi:hypothetical protein
MNNSSRQDSQTDTHQTVGDKSGQGLNPKRPGNSVREHLLHKAKQCDDLRKHYMDHLGSAQGNEVFKYMLVLNCIDCQSCVAETLLQAHQSFRWSTRAAVSGLLLVVATITAMIALPMLAQDVKIEITTISSISALMTTFISGVFFYLYRESLGRMDQFHTQLRETQKTIVGLLSGGESQGGVLRFQMSDQRAHPKAEEPAQAGPPRGKG